MVSDPGPNTAFNQSRVLLLPPTRRDASAIRKLLTDSGIGCCVCPTLDDLCDQIAHGCGVVLISEEAVTADPERLIGCIEAQEVWSDLPTIVLSRSGAESPKLTAVTPRLGNVSILERPMRITTMQSLIRSSLRGRERQYQVRAHLLERERVGRMKDEFLATLSHELRTPLNAILGWSQILNAPAHGDDLLDEGLQAIERNARAQTQIIEDLLDMNRIISGKVRMEVQRIDLIAVLRSAIDTVRPAADAKNVTLQVNARAPAEPIDGDPSRLQQVFWNLLSNAVKFTPRGQRIEVRVERDDGQLNVAVIDTGEGINADFLPHVFDRFRQADATMSRRHGGLGLGLAIVKQLVELHGGTIRASSPGAGRGATFVVSLPRTGASSEPCADDSRASVRSVAHATASENLAGVKILLVDDDPDARGMMRRLLESSQAIVTTAGSAAEGFDTLVSERPDVLISDIGMPGEDGYAFIRRVRRLVPDAIGATPALALTAYARKEDCADAVRAGYQVHLTKPVESAELIKAIVSLLRTPRSENAAMTVAP